MTRDEIRRQVSEAMRTLPDLCCTDGDFHFCALPPCGCANRCADAAISALLTAIEEPSEAMVAAYQKAAYTPEAEWKAMLAQLRKELP